MKKAISILLSFVLIFSVVSVSITTYAEEINEEKSISNFINGIVELSREYDAEKDFVPVDNENENVATATQFFSNVKTTQQETDSLDFQTARLIVRANSNFNDYGALEHISSFKDFHILQYGSPEAAMIAYKQLSNDENITLVELDKVYNCYQNDEIINEDITIDNKSKYLCEWSVKRTQSSQLQEYYSSFKLTKNDVIVGVIDSGVDYNHEFLKNRIIRSEFNASPDGNFNNEMDIELAHGTAVSSVIIDNSPDFVKVSVFRIADDSGNYTVTSLASAILEAITRKIDVINMSLGFTDESSLVKELILQAYEKNIPVVCAVGNLNGLSRNSLPGSIEEVIAVSAINQENVVASFNTFMPTADVSAPGEDIVVASLDNSYSISKGTSFASPCVSALVAVMIYEHPDWTVYNIENKLKYTVTEIDNYVGYHSRFEGEGLVQFCNALDINSIEKPKSNLSSYTYDEIQTCSLDTTDELKIIYTTDGTYPTKENGIIYDKPFEINEYTRVRAISFDEKTEDFSAELDMKIRIRYVGNEEDFEINENGIITGYYGNISDLIVPEKINGIQVTGFQKHVFNTENLIGLTLPYSVVEIPEDAFEKSTTIMYVEGKGVKDIGLRAFNEVRTLTFASFPNAVTVNTLAFGNTRNLRYVEFTNLETIAPQAFYNSGLVEFYGTKVKTIGFEAFAECSNIEVLSLSNCTDVDLGFFYTGMFNSTFMLLELDVSSLNMVPMHGFYDSNIEYVDFSSAQITEEYSFDKSDIKRVDFSNLITAGSLPINKNSIIVLPSTFKECTEDTKGRNYQVYGSKNTDAEKWANANGHTFIEISQETAVFEDVPKEYYGLGEILSPDVIGFNKTYQWYSNTEPNNTTGTPIEGATSKDFNPADYPESPYYYCVITSTDKGYGPIEIRTGITENKTVHIHAEEEIPAVAPTCTETGLTVGVKCSECGEIITVQQDIPALGHDYKSVVTEPTCTEQGYTTYTCECGDTYVSDTTNAIGHTPANAVEENYIAPSCTKNGSVDKVVYCSVCDEEISREAVVIEATGHADNDGNGYCDMDNELLDPSVECDHTCHSDNFFRTLFWKIINFFNRLFGLNKYCECGVTHY